MLGRIFKGILQSTETTMDQARDPWLKTRYYKATKDQVWRELQAAVRESNGARIVHESASIGEMTLELKALRTYDVTITAVGLTGMQVAVDVHVSLRGPGGDLGGSYRVLKRLQTLLDGLPLRRTE